MRENIIGKNDFPKICLKKCQANNNFQENLTITDILKALDRNESVTVLYHDKAKGIIKPAREKKALKVKDRSFFKMYAESEEIVLEALDNLRKPRHDF